MTGWVEDERFAGSAHADGGGGHGILHATSSPPLHTTASPAAQLLNWQPSPPSPFGHSSRQLEPASHSIAQLLSLH